MKKGKIDAVASLRDVRYKIAEKWADYENGEINDKEAKTHMGFATVLVNACKVETIRQHFTGITDQIDFLDYNHPIKVKGLSNDDVFKGNTSKVAG